MQVHIVIHGPLILSTVCQSASSHAVRSWRVPWLGGFDRQGQGSVLPQVVFQECESFLGLSQVSFYLHMYRVWWQVLIYAHNENLSFMRILVGDIIRRNEGVSELGK